MKTHFQASIPSPHRVGAGTMRKFPTRKQAEEFLKRADTEGIGIIEEVDEVGTVLARTNVRADR